jgi:glycosyltransferase involved in cell wall biosynthesis
MAAPADVSIVIPAFNEGPAIAAVVAALAESGPWHEIIVVDDGSRDETGANAAAAGATVVRHPYNKGNGAAVKSGIRRASGEFVLIIDGDGQHSPADARRLVARLGEYDLVVGARSNGTQATHTRRFGNAPSRTSRPAFAAPGGPACASSCTSCPTASRRRRRRRWRSSRPATTSPSSRPMRGSASAPRRSGSPVTAPSSS